MYISEIYLTILYKTDFHTAALESQAVVEKLGFGSRLYITFHITNYLTHVWLKMYEIDKSLATTNKATLKKRRCIGLY
jgi:hypothetical protein